MNFKYPLELEPGVDKIAVQDDGSTQPHYEPVTAVYRMGDKVVVETDRQQLRVDPGVKVQSWRLPA